jgi:hypothetical protein
MATRTELTIKELFRNYRLYITTILIFEMKSFINILKYSLIIITLPFLGCTDDEKKEPSGIAVVEYNGKKYHVDNGYYAPLSLEQNKLSFEFTTNSSRKIPIELFLQLDGEHNGAAVDLTQLDIQFDWSASISLYVETTDEPVIRYFAENSDDIELVEKGTFYMKTIDLETKIFEINLDAVIDGKTLKFFYNGELKILSES